MFLEDTQTGHLVRIADLDVLFNPLVASVTGRDQSGQEEQEPAEYRKVELIFPSGERLPRCWLDSQYRVHEMRRVRRRAWEGEGIA